jgi:hypothetical protein
LDNMLSNARHIKSRQSCHIELLYDDWFRLA